MLVCSSSSSNTNNSHKYSSSSYRIYTTSMASGFRSSAASSFGNANNSAQSAFGDAIKKRKTQAQGHMQRMKAPAAAQPAQADTSLLARYLLEEYAFGGISAAQVQRIAVLARHDGIEHSHVDSLAKLGTTGKHTDNIDRDLRQFMQSYLHPVKLPTSNHVDMPLKILKGKHTGTHDLPHHFLPPHKLASFLYDSFRPQFEAKVLGAPGALEEFWSNVDVADPRLQKLSRVHPDYMTTCIPIVLHGDGVPCTNNNTLDCLSWESLTAKRRLTNACSTLDYIFFITGVFTQTMDNDPTAGSGREKTKFKMWEPVAHSLRACYDGHWPALDTDNNEFADHSSIDFQRRGEPVAGGYKLVVWVIKGDMDFNVNHFELPGHWNSNNPCTSCSCVRDDEHLNDPSIPPSPMRWNDFSKGAMWKGHVFQDMTIYNAHCALLGKAVHKIYRPLEENGLGVHIKSQYMDTLHVVDLGVAKHVGGNVLWLLCFTDILTGTPEENMAQIWGEVQKHYKDRQTASQFSLLDISSFCDPKKPRSDFPLLKGKGAEVRHLMPILQTIWHQFARDTQYERFVGHVLDHLRGFYVCLDFRNEAGNIPFHLPEHVCAKLKSHVNQFLVFYSWLAKFHMDSAEQTLLWGVVPKFHYMWHIAHESSDLNPRLSWCYGNEDFVGKLAVIGMSCRHGAAAAHKSKSLIDKYILDIVLRIIHYQL